jgi:hypothetical protein
MVKTIQIVDYINKAYKGGMDAFLKEHGGLCYIPAPVDLMYVVHPKLPKEIQAGLYGMFGNSVVFGNTLNFNGLTEDSYNMISEQLGSKLNNIEGIGAVGAISNPCVVALTIPEIEKDDERVSKIISFLKVIPGLYRGCIICKDGEYITFEGSTILDDKIVAPLVMPCPKRDTPISDDDIANLIITLNTSASVEEFLKSI